jgi:hypothetical protein
MIEDLEQWIEWLVVDIRMYLNEPNETNSYTLKWTARKVFNLAIVLLDS